ncbi:MDR family MFS transporter, partial [Amycolatopsis orientalis]|uniref:MDR family MFS transporter n=1 Tax=Amycolatopsis orientalis TaxID=31958 RepID=UPI00041987D1
MATEQEAQPGRLQGGQLRVIVVSIMVCMVLSALDLTIVSTAAPKIVGELDGLPYLSWLFNTYVIVAGVTTPLYGKLSDMFGTRRLYLFALSTFLLGSALSGLAQTMFQLVAFRAVQGIGAGGLTVLTITVIAEVVPPADRGKYMGMFGSVLGVGAIAGPLLGGLLTDALSWRWIFYINLPLGLIALVAIFRALKLPPKRSDRPIDFLGFALLAGLVVAITLVTSWGGGEYDWGSSTILLLIGASAVLLVLFVARQLTAPEPIMPPRMFKVSSVTLACLANVFVHTWATVVPAFVPLFVQLAMGRTATNTALLQLPNILALMVVSTVSGNLITKWRRYKWAPVLGTALGVVSLLLFASMTPDTSQFLLMAYMALFGIAIGLCMQPLLVAIQVTAPEADMGAAVAAGTFSQRIGGAVGFAVMAALFSGWLGSRLATVGLTEKTASADSLGSLSPQTQALVHQAYADAISEVFLWTVPVVAAGLLISLLLKNIKVDEDVEIDV